MARYQQLPAGLPPHLVNRIAVPSRQGMRVGYGPGLNGLDSGLGSWFSSALKTVTKAVQIAVAPVTASILAPLKATAWAATKVGIPVKGIDSALRTEMNTVVKDLKTGAPIAAGVAFGVVTGGAGWVALAPLLLSSAAQLRAASLPKNQPQARAAATASAAAAAAYAAAANVPSVDVQATTGQQVDTAGRPVGQPDPAKVKALQAGFLPGNMNPLAVVGVLAALGIAGLYLARKTNTSQQP